MGWIMGTLGIFGIMGVFAMVERRNQRRQLTRIQACNVEEGQSIRFEYDSGSGPKLVTGKVEEVRDLTVNPVLVTKSNHWMGSTRLFTIKRDKGVLDHKSDNPFQQYYDAGIAEILTVR